MALRSDRLREIRELRGFSQRELDRLCGFGGEAIFRYENNKTGITADSLKTIADKLEVSADYLLGLSDEPRRFASSADLSQPERDMINAFRRKDWRSLLRLVTDHWGD